MSRTKIGRRVKLDFTNSPSRTKQSFKKQVDVNNILSRYAKTGSIVHFTKHEAKYADVTGVDFQNALDLAQNVERMFSELPATLRKRFDNDPAGFLDFVQNPDNIPEMEELGLRHPNKAELQETTLQGDTIEDEGGKVPETPPLPPENPGNPGGQ